MDNYLKNWWRIRKPRFIVGIIIISVLFIIKLFDYIFKLNFF